MWHLTELTHSYYRTKHPKEPKAVFIDPRTTFERFMNHLGYRKNSDIYDSQTEKGVPYSPWPNHNPNNLFGRFATNEGYFKKE